MPRQAVALKKYRCGTGPVSKTSDNEHTAAALWYSGKLSVQNSVGEPIPEDAQEPEEGTKVPSSVAGQDAGHVLPNQPAGAIPCSNGTKGKHEVATRVVQSLSESGDTERLARCSSAEKIDSCIRPLLKLRHVAPVRNIGVVMREHGAGERFDFRERDSFPAEWIPRDRCRFDATANTQETHFVSLVGLCLAHRNSGTNEPPFVAAKSLHLAHQRNPVPR
jgi:hypothetical protein